MIRILFVNAEADAPERLRQALRHRADRWELRFARGAAEALAELERQPAELVVCGAHLQDGSAGELLEQVRRRHPQTVRFVLSVGLDRGEAESVMPVAHQVLIRPDDILTLQRAIDRVADLLGKAQLPAVKRAVAAVHALPPLPQLYWKLTAELRRPECTSASAAAIVEQDPAMSARVLQLANSPYFGFGRAVRTVRDAATRLGLEQLRSALLSLMLSAAKMPLRLPPGYTMEALQNRSQHVAGLAASMMSHPEERKTAFSAGMLHHVGYFVLAGAMPQDFSKVMAAAADGDRPLPLVETEVLGCNHAEVGAFMLTLLGLPLPLVEAVAHHHRPSASGDKRFGPAGAVHVAALLAEAADGVPAAAQSWDEDFLRGLGALDIVGRWRAGQKINAVF
ncbi:MAG TPA: HDOD domain-containing protein [Nevskia sp.]|nr:HDOD domain-containing protein [Nevskia sp.]